MGVFNILNVLHQKLIAHKKGSFYFIPAKWKIELPILIYLFFKSM